MDEEKYYFVSFTRWRTGYSFPDFVSMTIAKHPKFFVDKYAERYSAVCSEYDLWSIDE